MKAEEYKDLALIADYIDKILDCPGSWSIRATLYRHYFSSIISIYDTTVTIRNHTSFTVTTINISLDHPDALNQLTNELHKLRH